MLLFSMRVAGSCRLSSRWSATAPWPPGRRRRRRRGRGRRGHHTLTQRGRLERRQATAHVIGRARDGRSASPRRAGSGCWGRSGCSRIRRPRPRPSSDRPPRSSAAPPPPRPHSAERDRDVISGDRGQGRAAAAAARRPRARRPRARSPCRSSSGTTPFFSARPSPRRCGAGPRPARRSRCKSSTPATRGTAPISDATARRRTPTETRRRRTRTRTRTIVPTDPAIRRDPRRLRRTSRGKRAGLPRLKRTATRAPTQATGSLHLGGSTRAMATAVADSTGAWDRSAFPPCQVHRPGAHHLHPGRGAARASQRGVRGGLAVLGPEQHAARDGGRLRRGRGHRGLG